MDGDARPFALRAFALLVHDPMDPAQLAAHPDAIDLPVEHITAGHPASREPGASPRRQCAHTTRWVRGVAEMVSRR
jgi:hypothetical protein